MKRWKSKKKNKNKKNNDYSSRETQITPHSHGVEKKGYFMLPYASLKNSSYICIVIFLRFVSSVLIEKSFEIEW